MREDNTDQKEDTEIDKERNRERGGQQEREGNTDQKEDNEIERQR